jgi:acetyl-CoA acetyltransferase
MTLRNKAAIVGLGATEFSRNSGRSEMTLAVEAVTAALADAGLAPADVDGIATYTMENNDEIDVFANIGGKDLKFFSRIAHGGGGACAPMQQAAMAIATGVARVVICYRAMNERSQYRFGRGAVLTSIASTSVSENMHGLQGLRTPAAAIAMIMRRYMHLTGATEADFGQIAVSARRHAATNPAAAFFGKPITLDDYFEAPMIADPLRLLDCCQESDGAVAIVITSAEQAQDLKTRPVLIRGAAQGARDRQRSLHSYYRTDISRASESELVAEQLYRQSGLEPKDIDAAMIYDHFGPTIMLALEAYGFCERGDAKNFIKNGNIEIGGALPINTHGGQVGEAYIHGMNGVAEAIRQLRGTAVNQVRGPHHILVTGGMAVPTSGVILSSVETA